MKIGTLSAACTTNGGKIAKHIENKDEYYKDYELKILPRISNRMNMVERIVNDSKCNPDILITSGAFLESDNDLFKLSVRLSSLNWDGLLIVEVRKSERLPHVLDVGGESFQLMQHCLYAWTRRMGPKALGRQCFANSTDVRRNLLALETEINGREVVFRGLKVGALICGEINVLRSNRHDNIPAYRSEIVGNYLKGWNIVVNPTHDRMGRDFILSPKRSLLSTASGPDGVYVSVSNWNIGKRQGRTAKSLHTVYVDGRPVEMVSPLAGQLDDFEYRQVTV